MTRRTALVAIVLGAALCFGVAGARALAVPLSADIALQLHIAQVLAEGGRFGRDVIEVNPPLSAWLELPVLAIARAAGVSAALVHDGAVTVLGVACVLLLALAGSYVGVLRAPMRLAAFCLAAALALSLQAGLVVGQREQLAIVLVLPFFALLAARLEGTEVPVPLTLAVGIAAGAGFALKPFFALPLLLGELLLVSRRPLAAVLRRPELVAVGTVFVAYAVAVALLAPGWLASAREFWPLYGAYRPATLYDILTRQGIVIVVSLVAMLAWVLTRPAAGGRSRLGDALATALAGFLVAMVAQRKPWIYLAIPSGVLSLLLLVTTVLETEGRLVTRGGRMLRALLVVVTGLRTARYAWWLVHAPALSATDRASLADYTGLRAALESLPPGSTMAALSPTHGVTFPLVQDVGARWVMRLPSLWPAISRAAQDDAHQDALRRIVAEDLARGRPDILLVLVPRTTYGWLGPAAMRDWRQWLAELPEGAAVLAPYRPWRTVGEFSVWRRQPAANGAAASP